MGCSAQVVTPCLPAPPHHLLDRQTADQLSDNKDRFQCEVRRRIPAMLKLRALRVRSALARECMAEFLGTFVLLVSESV